MRLRQQRLLDVHAEGVDHLRDALAAGHGVLITPNHPSHADPFAMYEAADRVPSPFYFMATWHVFDGRRLPGQLMLQSHGIFSVDREGADLAAFRDALAILQDRPHPLVIFPEGEIYHCNDRVTPFRDGPATIALSAARRAKRDIVCIPCALKYEYIDDPMPQLLEIMDQLERQIHWRPRRDRPLADRIYAFAEAMLTLKEMEFFQQSRSGPLPDRIAALAEAILGRLEERHQAEASGTIPERIKELRRRCLEQLADVDVESPQCKQLNDDLDDVFLAAQAFSYPGDYVAESPNIERLAETLDKFEEDVLHRSATVRGTRRATVTFDEPVPVESGKRSKTAAAELTDLLESRVQAMLDAHRSRESDAD
jgi:1-acyl-sn-glycerol-3-phosphate acyltransferase